MIITIIITIINSFVKKNKRGQGLGVRVIVIIKY